MTERNTRIAAFLTRHGWGDAHRQALAGDASSRRYHRLSRDGASVVLMDAPPDTGEDVRPFLRIAAHLSGLGLSAPAIVAADDAQGLVLLEDFGDALFARQIAAEPAVEAEYYTAAVDVLAEVQAHSVPRGVSVFDPDAMTAATGLAWDWYADDTAGKPDGQAALHALLSRYRPDRPVLALRDFHAENLFWLPGRTGPARVGLIDFQDAVATHPAYDLVSLTHDARRDLSPGLAEALTGRFIAATGQDPAAFRTAAAVIAVQRNLRILGVFARLCRRYGKPHYLDLIPRVWAHLQADLSAPEMSGLLTILGATLPNPEPSYLSELKSKCLRPRP